MYADTINSVSKLLSGTSKPVVTISLDNPQPAYTTFSPLSGTVTVIAPVTTTFSTIDVSFEGFTSTYVEKMATAGTNYRSTACHTFLKLIMPIPQSSYPEERTLLANEVYSFPFNFVIPNQLLPQSCTHKCASRPVHFAHLSLPPSSGNSSASHQDLCPDMVKITYAIKAKVTKSLESGKTQKLCHTLLPLNVLPAVPEAPPMSIEPGDKDYNLLKTKVLKKGMFKGKKGRITLKAEQPRDFMLSVPSASYSSEPLTTSSTSSSSASSSTSFSPFSSSDSESGVAQASLEPLTALTHLKLTVNFEPDPSHLEAEPPRLSSLSSKLRSSTFYAARAANVLPTRSQTSERYDPNVGLYENTMSLPSRNLSSISWVRNEPLGEPTAPPLYEATAPALRRERRSSDSGYSTLSDHESDGSKKKEAAAPGTTYTAQISLPLSLPAEKTITWLPTFHSCLVSRTYTLELSLSLASIAVVPSTTLSLKVPVRIGVLAAGERRGNGIGPPLAVFAQASEQPSGDQIESSQHEVLPPQYEVFVGAGSGMAQRRRGGLLNHSSGFPVGPSGVMVETHDSSADGLSLTTGGNWDANFGLTGHGR